jgi:thioredoxin-dependent peroxiredoxin
LSRLRKDAKNAPLFLNPADQNNMLKTLIGICLAVAALVAFLLSTSHAEPLAKGAEAPSLKSVDENGAPFDLAEAWKKGTTLVYFYPKASTPGCTKQGCALRDNWEALQKAGIHVIGVSMDKPDAQKAFKEQQKFPFPLLADSEGAVVKAFGVAVMRVGLPTRQSFLVHQGKVVWHDAKVDPATHLEKVLEAAKALKP